MALPRRARPRLRSARRGELAGSGTRDTVDPRFARAYTDHARQIYRYFARRLGPGAAEDLTADTFTTALGAWERFDAERGDVLPWLFGIAANIGANHRRRELRHLALLSHRGLDPLDPPDHESEVVGRLDAERDAKVAAATLARLPDFDREALLLLAWDGLTYAQIAEALGSTTAHVRSRLHEARLVLRADLGHAAGGDAR